MGADCIYLSKVGEDEQKTVKTVHSLLDRPPDVTIECSGADANIRLAILVRMTRFMFVVTCTSLLICLIYDYHSPPPSYSWYVLCWKLRLHFNFTTLPIQSMYVTSNATQKST